MVHGIIDLGSNTIRLSVFSFENNKIKVLQNKKTIVGLASCIENGGLTEKGITKTCEVLNRYKDILKEMNIEELSVFATASLRNISNREYVLNEIKEKTGITPEILFGDEEARLDFVSIKNYFQIDKGIIVDIGGGSTEIVLYENGEIKRLASIPIGALSLQNKVVKKITPSKREFKIMKKTIKKSLDELKWDFENDYSKMYAIGGTSRAVLEVAEEILNVCDGERTFSRENLKEIIKRLKSIEPDENKEIYRIVPERIFSIAGGIVILYEIVKRFGCDVITVSKAGIREGYFIDKIINKSGCDAVEK